MVSVAAGAGFDAVGIRVWPAADEPAYPMLTDTRMMRETLARLADTGVRVLDVEVLRLRPDSRHDDALRILDAGERLGARAVLVIGNDPEETRLVERFRAVCEAAAARGMRACLEFMLFSSVRTVADAVRVVERAAHPAAAILVDALHMQRSGAGPADIAALPPAWLPYAQLCDAPFEPIGPSVEHILAALQAKQAMWYRFRRDEKGWRVFVSTAIMRTPTCSDVRLGAIGVDFNVGFATVSQTDRFGNIIASQDVPMVTAGLSKHATLTTISLAVQKIIAIACKAQKPISIEFLDFAKKKPSFPMRRRADRGCGRRSRTPASP